MDVWGGKSLPVKSFQVLMDRSNGQTVRHAIVMLTRATVADRTGDIDFPYDPRPTARHGMGVPHSFPVCHEVDPMSSRYLQPLAVPLLWLAFAALPVGCSGSDGSTGPAGPTGPQGPAGPAAINAATAPASTLEELSVVTAVTGVTIASPPVVTFTVMTAEGVPIIGLGHWKDINARFIRFDIAKLVAGTNGDPDSWVSYIRSSTGAPTTENTGDLVDNGDGSYTYTFVTDITNVTGITYEPTLTHRLAGQIGQLSTVPLEESNVWFDFVPDGSAITTTRNIASTDSCNECHDKLAVHGRRFEVQYCVTCHNPDLEEGEGNMSFMIHRIHSAGDFHVLNNAQSFAEVTYPQDVLNCRKCHNADDTDTPQANNWRELPSMESCGGCHDIFGPNATLTHSGPAQTNNADCTGCHTPEGTTEYHTTANPTPNNPELLTDQRSISYELISAAVDTNTDDITIEFKILDGETPIDVTDIPADLRNGSSVPFSYPSFLLAYAMSQDGITEPADYNNLGQAGGQPLSVSLSNLTPYTGTNYGSLTYDSNTGIATAVITSASRQFPSGATMRAVALQGYFQQDLNADGTADTPLHALSVYIAVTGDSVRREVVDASKCAQCHEWFEGHGGNRNFGSGSGMVCVVCHVPNLSSSGRTMTTNPSPTSTEPWPADPMDNPEDSQNLKDMIHGIHASALRDRDYTHVRNRNSGFWYNWSEVTFPAETNKCLLCHLDGTYELPLNANVLPTIVRTTGVADGLDANTAAVTAARGASALPNTTDWINTPTASACYYCHTSQTAWAHMTQNGGQLSDPRVGEANYVNRSALVLNYESCALCHGPGRTADLEVVHSR